VSSDTGRPPKDTHALPTRARVLALGVVVLLVAIIALLAMRDPGPSRVRPRAEIGQIRADPVTGPFRGLGVWVDIYDEPTWTDPVGAVATMAEHGVRTLYLETSNDHRPGPFVFEEGVGALLEAAHDRGIDVIAWYLPGFVDREEDLSRSVAAVHLRSPRGDAFDGFALDIESMDQKDIERRTRNLLWISRALREEVGDGYPLGAITPLPDWVEEDAGYWPGFPYGDLAMIYDAILPMTYFTWRVDGPEEVVSFTARNITVIREQVANPDVPIHVIGGLARDATSAETRAFVQAARGAHVLGASYYSLPMITPGQWVGLERIAAPGSG
jgi:hypothetical protein